MKRFLIAILFVILVCPIFAKTIQKVEKYQVYYDDHYTYDVTPAMNYMLKNGWRIVSITPVTRDEGYNNPTDYIIVVYEKDE